MRLHGNAIRATLLAGITGILFSPSASHAQKALCSDLHALVDKQGKEIDRSIREMTPIESQPAKLCVYSRKVAIPLNQRHIRELGAEKNNRCFDPIGTMLLKGMKERMVHFLKLVEDGCETAGMGTEILTASEAKCAPRVGSKASIDDCNKPIQQDMGGYQIRGIACMSALKFDNSITAFTEALRLGCPKNTCQSNRGRAYIGNNENDEAIRDFDELIETKGAGSFTNTWRAMAYYKKGEFQRAIIDADEALQHTKDPAFPLYVRGLAKIKQGDRANGKADIGAAVAADANSKYPQTEGLANHIACFYGLTAN